VSRRSSRDENISARIAAQGADHEKSNHRCRAGFALAASVFVEVSTYEEIVSIADASIDAPAF
jgi:hypothetical protein